MVISDKYNLFSFPSDAALSSLSPIDPWPFDSSSFDCLTHNILQDLMKLTFLADEKQLSVNPLSLRRPRQSSVSEDPSSSGKPSNTSSASDKGELERRLDADIARVLGQEDLEEEECMDHNADKKKKARAPIACHEDDSPDELGVGGGAWWQRGSVEGALGAGGPLPQLIPENVSELLSYSTCHVDWAMDDEAYTKMSIGKFSGIVRKIISI